MSGATANKIIHRLGFSSGLWIMGSDVNIKVQAIVDNGFIFNGFKMVKKVSIQLFMSCKLIKVS